jgi:hypothetical protein
VTHKENKKNGPQGQGGRIVLPAVLPALNLSVERHGWLSPHLRLSAHMLAGGGAVAHVPSALLEP